MDSGVALGVSTNSQSRRTSKAGTRTGTGTAAEDYPQSASSSSLAAADDHPTQTPSTPSDSPDSFLTTATGNTNGNGNGNGNGHSPAGPLTSNKAVSHSLSVASSSADDRTLHQAPSEDPANRGIAATASGKTFTMPASPSAANGSTTLFDPSLRPTLSSSSPTTQRQQQQQAQGLSVDTTSSSSDNAATAGVAPAAAAAGITQSRSSGERRFGPYVLHKTLGEGQFGKVKLASLVPAGSTPTGSPSPTTPLSAPLHHVAIKLVRKDTIIRDPVRRTKLAREIALLRRVCSHPNIVTLEQVIETERYVGIVMEYAQGGELFDRILASKSLKPEETRWFFLQLLDGVQHLHQRGVVHRDLKLENLLLAWDEEGPAPALRLSGNGLAAPPSPDGTNKENMSSSGRRNPPGYGKERIVITDFGFATTVVTEQAPTSGTPPPPPPQPSSSDNVPPSPTAAPAILAPPPEVPHRLLQTSCGSPCYAAPELVLGDPEGRGYDGVKADLWSCGVILYAMCCGYLPFDDDPNNPQSSDIQMLYKHIMSSQLTYPKHVPIAIREVVEGLLRRNPKQRWGWNDVRANEWVKTGTLSMGVSVAARMEKRVEEKLAAAVAAANLPPAQAQQRKAVAAVGAASAASSQRGSSTTSPVPGGSSRPSALEANMGSVPAAPPATRLVSEVSLPPQIESGVIKALAKDISTGSATVKVKAAAPIPEPEPSRISRLTFARRFTAPWRSNDEDNFGQRPNGGRSIFGSRASMASSRQSRRSAISAASSRVSEAAKSAWSSAGRSISALFRLSRPGRAAQDQQQSPGQDVGDETIEERDAAVADVELKFDDDETDGASPTLGEPPAMDAKQRAPDLIVPERSALEVRMLVESTLRDLEGCEWRGWGNLRDGGAWTCRGSFLGTVGQGSASSLASSSSSAPTSPVGARQRASGFLGRLLGRQKGAAKPAAASSLASGLVTTEVAIVAMQGNKYGVSVRRAVDDALGEDVWAWTARKRTVVDALAVVMGLKREVESYSANAQGPPLLVRGGDSGAGSY